MTSVDPKVAIRERAREVLEQRRKELERYDWQKIARPNQLPPAGDWRTWLLLAGRGFGKTRTGAEWVRSQIESGRCKRMALVAPTAADVRDVIVEGESGILAVSRPDFRPMYEPSKRRLTWPNGAIATTYSADEPERLRGPQHDSAYCDEVGAWRYSDQTWAMLMFGLRLGADPRVVVTTTPRPINLIRELVKAKDTVVTRGSTYDNRANLAPQFFAQIISKYEGTRLGRQELDAELLEDVPDSLWKRAWFDALRVTRDELPELVRIVVAIDPAVTSEAESDQTGIVIVGRGENGHGYVLEDLSCRVSPREWATKAIEGYRKWNADGIVAETNQGGDLVEETLRAVDADIPYRAVRASRGKHVRAEPISALYEQGKVHHVGKFNLLEDQMCAMLPAGYTGAGSPDVLDAAVWGLTEIMAGKAGDIAFFSEFRPTGPRSNEPREANHVITTKTYLAPWWHRWISITWGKQIVMHWYAQHQDGRVHVYRELIPDTVSAEEAGALLAEQSLGELTNIKNLTAWIAPEYFDAGLARKSVAQQLAEGIDSVLGEGSGFLWKLTDEERSIDNERALVSLARRRDRITHGITIQAAVDDAAGGWEHLRSLLRWWPLYRQSDVQYDPVHAKALLAEEDGQRKLQEYLKKVESESDEVLPGIVIHDCCQETIKSLSSLTRSEKDPNLPAEGPSSAPAESLLLGAIAHGGEQNREPIESFTARRIEAAKERNPLIDATGLHQVAQKAEIDYNSRELKTFRFARIPRRPRG